MPIAVIPAHDSRVANKYRTPAATMALTTFNLSPLGRRRNVLVEVEQVRSIVPHRCKLGIFVRTVGSRTRSSLLAEEVHINSGFALDTNTSHSQGTEGPQWVKLGCRDRVRCAAAYSLRPVIPVGAWHFT